MGVVSHRGGEDDVDLDRSVVKKKDAWMMKEGMELVVSELSVKVFRQVSSRLNRFI